MTAMSGASSEAIHRTSVLAAMRNRPIVDRIRRPVNATMTGRTNRSVRTRIIAATRNGRTPAPRSWRIGALSGPNGNGCETVGMLSSRMMTRRTNASARASTMNRRIPSSFLSLASPAGDVIGRAGPRRSGARRRAALGVELERRLGLRLLLAVEVDAPLVQVGAGLARRP